MSSEATCSSFYHTDKQSCHIVHEYSSENSSKFYNRDRGFLYQHNITDRSGSNLENYSYQSALLNWRDAPSSKANSPNLFVNNKPSWSINYHPKYVNEENHKHSITSNERERDSAHNISKESLSKCSLHQG